MKIKIATSAICLALSVFLLAEIVSAADYPKLYSGKADIVTSTQTSYTSEVFDDSGQETSRVKVFVRDDSSPDYPHSPFDASTTIGCDVYDCLARSLISTLPYYQLGDYRHPDMKLYSGKVAVNGKDVESDAALVYPPRQIVGDVYSPGNTFNGFTFMGGNHLYAGSDPGSNAAWKAAGYQIDSNSLLSWDDSNFAKNLAMRQNINRLISFAHELTTLVSPFNLSPAPNALDNPEGEIWYQSGDLTIDDAIEFQGKGTLIIGGDLTIGINALVNSNGAQLGIISLGGVTIENTGSRKVSLRAAIFSPNTVAIKAPIEFTGSIAANKIDITSTTAIIKYDKQLTVSPPPGMNYFMSPSVITTH